MTLPTSIIYRNFININKQFGDDPTKYEFGFVSIYDLFDIVTVCLCNQFNSNYIFKSDVFRNFFISLDEIIVFRAKDGELQQLWEFYESEVLRNKLNILSDSF